MINVFFLEAVKYSMKASTAEDVLFIGLHLDMGDLSISINNPRRCEFLSQIINHKEFSLSEVENLIDAAKMERPFVFGRVMLLFLHVVLHFFVSN